jgi:hypothetical protein
MAWALQGGAVALVEAWTLHTATSALIRAVPSVAARPPDATEQMRPADLPPAKASLPSSAKAASAIPSSLCSVEAR